MMSPLQKGTNQSHRFRLSMSCRPKCYRCLQQTGTNQRHQIACATSCTYNLRFVHASVNGYLWGATNCTPSWCILHAKCGTHPARSKANEQEGKTTNAPVVAELGLTGAAFHRQLKGSRWRRPYASWQVHRCRMLYDLMFVNSLQLWNRSWSLTIGVEPHCL